MTIHGPLLLPLPRRAELDPRSTVVGHGEPSTGIDPTLPAQGYRLTVSGSGGLQLEAADDAGRFYAETTLAQLRAAGGGRLPVGTIEDWPDLAVRGVMLDVSRTKVPTLETLFALVERMASWKLNQLQLYTEHTFAYPGHEEVWEPADALSAADMERLRAHCAARHVELVANQNTLGHMERWLMHDRYRPLGIARGVVSGPLGIPLPASTLDPAHPGSLALVRELLGVLGDALPGDLLHVGMDEPWDLPSDRSHEWGTWLERLRRLPETAGRRLLVWGDMPATHPELLGACGGDVVVCEWGYEAGHPFAERLAALAGDGVGRWVCPGTSSWLSIVGRATNAVENCAAAARAAAGGGAEAMLVTDWGDFGHLQHLPVSDPGLAAAACFSWCLEAHDDLDTSWLARALDAHCYGDGSGELGAAVLALGDVHRLVPGQVPNVSSLVLHLYFPQLPVGGAIHGPLTHGHLDTARGTVEDALAALGRARPSGDHGRLAVEELTVSGHLVELCIDDAGARLSGDGTLASVPAARRAEMARRLEELVVAQKGCWLARNRPGGLVESLAWLEHLGHCYASAEPEADWAGPLVEAARAGGHGR